MTHFHRPTQTDASLVKMHFRAAGISARFRMGRYGFRVIFSGPRAPAFAILNALGFRDPCGGLWTEMQFTTEPTEWEFFVNLKVPEAA